MSSHTQTIGSINEKGFINNLLRKGFNMNRALSELIMNSIDAGCTKVDCISNKVLNKILLSDDGNGMTKEQLKYMWDAYRENHSDKKSGGVSGLGSKPSTLIMSNTSKVIVYTKSKDSSYIKAIIPWNEIVEEGIYSNKIKIEDMEDDDITMFKLYQNKTGTIIEFIYNHELYNCLKLQFLDSKKIQDITQRSDWIFSEFPQKITFIDEEHNERKELCKYSYFSGHNNEYYELNVVTIEVFKKGNNDIIYAIKLEENKYTNIVENKRGFQMNDFIEFRSCIKIGTIIVKCGMRKDDKYFNSSNPVLPGASKVLLDYESKFFSNGVSGENSGDEIKSSLWFPHIMRNGQNIGIIKSLPKMNHASARANGKSCLSNNHIRTKVIYDVDSSQTNKMDELFGIQENKNQLNSYNINVKFLRTIEYIMKLTSDNIWNSFEKQVQKHKAKLEKERKEKQAKLEKERKEKEQKEKERKEKEEKEKERKEKEEDTTNNILEDNTDSESDSDSDDNENNTDTEDDENEHEDDDDNYFHDAPDIPPNFENDKKLCIEKYKKELENHKKEIEKIEKILLQIENIDHKTFYEKYAN